MVSWRTVIFVVAVLALLFQSLRWQYRQYAAVSLPRYAFQALDASLSSKERSAPRKRSGERQVVAHNRLGQQVGWAILPGQSEFHACLWEGGKTTDLGTLGGKSSFACGINDVGEIVGYARTAEGDNHACLWRNGIPHDLGTLGGRDSFAYGINNLGHIVGDADTAQGETHAFFYCEAKMTDLGTLGGLQSAARGINDKDQIVGYAAARTTGITHAFLWLNNRMIDLNQSLPHHSEWELIEGKQIEDGGQILVEGERPTGHQLLLLTPIASPVRSETQP